MKHKNYKRLTRSQKIALSEFDSRYKPDKWLCVNDSPAALVLIHKETGKLLAIPKGGGSK